MHERSNHFEKCQTYDIQEELGRIIESQPLIMREHIQTIISMAIGNAIEEGFAGGLRYANGERCFKVGQTEVELLASYSETELNLRGL